MLAAVLQFSEFPNTNFPEVFSVWKTTCVMVACTWSLLQPPTVPDSLRVLVPMLTTPVPEGPAPCPSIARPPAATIRTMAA